MHDPTAIFRFEEQTCICPLVVLEELDAHKKGLSKPRATVRQVEPLPGRHDARGHQGADRPWLQLPSGYSGNHGKKPPPGGCIFQTRQLSSVLPDSLPGQRRRQCHPGTDAGAAERARGRPRSFSSPRHQSAHQGAVLGGRRGLLQRQDPRGCRHPLQRLTALPRTSGSGTQDIPRGRKPTAPSMNHRPRGARVAAEPGSVRGTRLRHGCVPPQDERGDTCHIELMRDHSQYEPPTMSGASRRAQP